MLNPRIFDEFDEFRRSFDRLFENFSQYPRTQSGNGSDWYFTPPVETGWTEEQLNLRFVLPAVADNDVEVTVQGNQLIVRGERRAPQGFGKPEATYHRLPYGKFERALDLPNGLNTDGLQASLHDGVLDIRIPIAEAMKPKKIEIKAGEGAKAIAG